MYVSMFVCYLYWVFFISICLFFCHESMFSCTFRISVAQWSVVAKTLLCYDNLFEYDKIQSLKVCKWIGNTIFFFAMNARLNNLHSYFKRIMPYVINFIYLRSRHFVQKITLVPLETAGLKSSNWHQFWGNSLDWDVGCQRLMLVPLETECGWRRRSWPGGTLCRGPPSRLNPEPRIIRDGRRVGGSSCEAAQLSVTLFLVGLVHDLTTGIM